VNVPSDPLGQLVGGQPEAVGIVRVKGVGRNAAGVGAALSDLWRLGAVFVVTAGDLLASRTRCSRSCVPISCAVVTVLTASSLLAVTPGQHLVQGAEVVWERSPVPAGLLTQFDVLDTQSRPAQRTAISCCPRIQTISAV
jgi:hypothetical protein